MEELDLKELFSFYLRKSPIIIFITILFAILGFCYNEYIQVPMYHGTTTIILVQSNQQTNSNITQNEITINEKLISTYSEIIKSRSVLERVIEKLNLTTTTKELEKQISVNKVNDTSIIDITVSDKNNEKAALIANRLAKEFQKEITKIYNLENVSVIDEAIIEEEPHNVNKTKQMIIFIALGIIISSIIIFIIFYFDNTVKSKKDIDTYLKIPVLGEIPSSKKLLKQKIIKREGIK